MTDEGRDQDRSQGNMDPERHYDEFGVGEWERLEANLVTRWEYENTVSVLNEHLPEEGTALDAGGGPGRYAIWLAERGYAVEHLDLSTEQVRIAREQAEAHGVPERIRSRTGDIRDLPFADDRFDAVCCLGGPLTHVVDADERERAARELRRVAAPGAPVFVSVIGRLSAVRYSIRHGLDAHPEILPEIARTGDYTQDLLDRYGGEGWAECHFFRADEFESLLASAGLTVERLVGLEGLASLMQSEVADASEEAIEAVRAVVEQLFDDRSVADTSEHMLAVCRA